MNKIVLIKIRCKRQKNVRNALICKPANGVFFTVSPGVRKATASFSFEFPFFQQTCTLWLIYHNILKRPLGFLCCLIKNASHYNSARNMFSGRVFQHAKLQTFAGHRIHSSLIIHLNEVNTGYFTKPEITHKNFPSTKTLASTQKKLGRHVLALKTSVICCSEFSFSFYT